MSLPAGGDIFASTVGAFEFAPANSDTSYSLTNITGLEALLSASPTAGFITNVHLPTGALLDHIELDYCDTNAGNDLLLVLDDCLDDAGGPGACSPLAFVSPNTSGGCAFADSAFVGATIDNTNHDYVISISFPLDSTDIGFRGAKLYYTLQVSPAPGTATFNDVPTSDPAFQFIEAFAKAGITAGCSATPPLYCPDANVTRRQMAVFFAKAFGLRWPG
jgi:hypothetical protein